MGIWRFWRDNYGVKNKHYQKQTCEKPCAIVCEKVVIFTWYSHVFHTYFTWNSTCMWNFAMWKACENNVKKGCEKCYPFHTVFHCSIRQVHTPNMCTVWNDGCFHAVFIRFSHDNFICMWNFPVWEACEKNVKYMWKKLPFCTVFHMLCQRRKIGKLSLS